MTSRVSFWGRLRLRARYLRWSAIETAEINIPHIDTLVSGSSDETARVTTMDGRRMSLAEFKRLRPDLERARY